MLTLVRLVLQVRHAPCSFLEHVVDQMSLFLMDLYHLQLSQVLVSTAVLDHLLVNEQFGKRFGREQVFEAMVDAIKRNNLVALQRLVRYDPLVEWQDDGTRVLEAAVQQRNLEIISWMWRHFQKQLCVQNVEVLDALAFEERLDVLHLLFDEQMLVDPAQAAIRVASDGEPTSTRISLARERIHCVQCVMEHLLVNGHCELPKWMENLDDREQTRGCCTREHELSLSSSLDTKEFWDEQCFVAQLVLQGGMHALRWLLVRCDQFTIDHRVLIWSARVDDVELFEWVYRQVLCNGDQYKDWMGGISFAFASRLGNFHVMKFLMDRGCSVASVQQAYANGEAQVVQYIQHLWSNSVGNFATQVIEHVISHSDSVPADYAIHWVATLCQTCNAIDHKYLIEQAAGHPAGVALLQDLDVKRQSMQIQFVALQAALRVGRADTVKYLLDSSVEGNLLWCPYVLCRKDPFDEYFSNEEVALHFVSRNLFVEEVIRCAARTKQFGLLRDLHVRGVQGFTCTVMDDAAAVGCLPIVRFLHEHREEGCTTRAMDEAAAGGYLHVVKFLHEHRPEGCTTNALDAAAQNGHVRIVQFLHANRREGCTSRAFSGAAERGHLQVVQYLWQTESKDKLGVQSALELSCLNGWWRVVQWLVAIVKDELDYASALSLVWSVKEIDPGSRSRLGKKRIAVLLETQLSATRARREM